MGGATVSSKNRGERNRSLYAGLPALCSASAIIGACALIGQTINPTILEGNQYAHVIELPSGFVRPPAVKGPYPLDHYTFRVAGDGPRVLLIAACVYAPLPGHQLEETPRSCSPNAFAIDVEDGYGARLAESNEWAQAKPVGDEHEMDDPYRRNLLDEMKKSPNMRPNPIDPSYGRGAEYEGYTYRGNEYRRRGDWIVNLHFASSHDGRLVLLAGIDKRKAPKYGFPDPINGGHSGLVTLDIFDASPARRLASVDLDSHINVNVARRRISLVDSRWVVIGLTADLRKMLLFDFKQAGGAN